MSLFTFIMLMGLPAAGAGLAWAAVLRAWREVDLRTLPGSNGREARGRAIPFVVLPTILIVFGLVVTLLLLGRAVPDSLALPAALAYAVPALLSGVGMAIIGRRGLLAAAASKQGFGRVLPLAVMPQTAAVFGLVVSFFVIGLSAGSSGSPSLRAEMSWLAALLTMAGGVGAPLGAQLAASAWDFETIVTWPKALSRSARGGYLTIVSFTIAMAVLGEWFMVLLMVLYFGGTFAFGLLLFMRARRRRSDARRS